MKQRDLPKYRGYPIVFLPPALYDAAKRLGYDMNYYCKTEPIPK